MNCRTDINEPFLLSPAGKDYLWGGSRLKDEFGKNLPMSPLAESWECAAHPDGTSTVVNGAFSGETLLSVLAWHPEILGERFREKGQLPILLKLIDAKEDLSVQVHPNDRYAALHENGQRGKTELWYVLDASPDARIIYGLSHDMTKESFRKAVEGGRVSDYLQKIPVRKDDVFYIPAGTIHAIGAGCLIAEIQENSNLTYRIHDYDRTGPDGKKRPLHLAKALDAARLKAAITPRQPLRVLRYHPGSATELLARCPYFEVHRMLINTERREEVIFQSDRMSFRVLLILGGSGSISFADKRLECFKGDCIFVPAASLPLILRGQMQLLDVRA